MTMTGMQEDGYPHFGGFGAQRLPPADWPERDERLLRNRARLARALNLHTTVAFVGAGCSSPLGYPTWEDFTQMAVDRTCKFIEAHSSYAEFKTDFERLQKFNAILKVNPELFSFILGICKKILFRHKALGEDEYRLFLQEKFSDRTPEHGVKSPYDFLLDLPIKRFITSNYDCEIEKALHYKRRIPKAEFEQRLEDVTSGKRRRAFTQRDEYCDQLALFAMARVEEADNTVFHCHGYYGDPDSMVVTESDYQRWYLRRGSREGEAFRQTIDLLFNSNPILFVGYGLGDDDLLRPLRMLAADNPNPTTARPLFALLHEEEEGKDEEYHQFLYTRYGLHVIPFESPNLKDRGNDLCSALVDLQQDWFRWQDEWHKKPYIRKVRLVPEKPAAYHHYPAFEDREDRIFGRSRFEDLLGRFREAVREDVDVNDITHIFALIGPGGTGKSWCAERLMKKLEEAQGQPGNAKKFQGFFFWSSYYSNDSLTGVDRVLAYLDPTRMERGSRLDRLKACLRKGRYLVIFDGIERFLREGDTPNEGRGFSPGATEFLRCLADPYSCSTVVITSRLWPEAFGPPGSRKDIQRVRLQPFRTSDLKEPGVEPFNWLDDTEVSEICSLLDGHIYGIALAAELLRQEGEQGASPRLIELRRALAATPPDRRTSRMIVEAIRVLDAPEKWDGLAQKLLERLAVFMSPVDKRTLDICFESAIKDAAKTPSYDREELVNKLVTNKLVQRVCNKRQGDQVAYSMHPLVRGYIFQRVHRAFTDELPDFTLPGFTASTVDVHPGSEESVYLITDIFDRLYSAAEQSRQRSYEAEDTLEKKEKLEEAVALCRSTFGVIRSRMGSNTAPRWHSYNHYAQFVLRLGNLAKYVAAPAIWSYAERRDVQKVDDENGPLYADELAWLYNEIGLSCYGEGMMLDALAVWEQGYEINRVIDSYEEGGNYFFQSQCNLGAAYIHLGRLDIACRYLREAERTNYLVQDDDHGGRIKGYQALVQHLRGDLKEADRLYGEAQSLLKRRPGGNARAQSIFMRHWGDLRMALGDKKDAGLHILNSRSLAEAGRYPELVAYARLSYGHWCRLKKNYEEALNEYNAVLDEARRIGIRRLESEALSELSRLACDLGDAQIARQRAIEALRIANESSLGLRQTHGLVVLGRATIQAGERDLGIAYLRHAQRLAKRQEYWLRGSEAEGLLQRLGASTDSTSVRIQGEPRLRR